MDKMNKKAELLKMLADEMMSSEREESMESLHGMGKMHEMKEEMMGDAPVKATIMAEDEKGLIEGAKKLPEILDKAEAFKKLRLGEKKKKNK